MLFLSLKMTNEPILACIYFISYFSFQILKTFDCGFLIKSIRKKSLGTIIINIICLVPQRFLHDLVQNQSPSGSLPFFSFFLNFIYLFIYLLFFFFGCVGSSFLCKGFL